MMNIERELLPLIRLALAEDIGEGDITGQLISADAITIGRFLVKAQGVIAGLEVAQLVFAELDPTLHFVSLSEEGAQVQRGDIVAEVRGRVRPILAGERTALNFMQRMSGIATATRNMVSAIAGTNAVILDTRKTVPCLRHFDKWAVRIGGGQNHRIGLYDMALIKDNHIAAAGGVTAAVIQQRAVIGDRPIPIEVEVTNLAQLEEALTLNVDRIMLDNMNLEQMRQAVAMTNGRTKLEASGGVNLATVRAIAETGVDFISSGALTHSVIALDISLELEENSAGSRDRYQLQI